MTISYKFTNGTAADADEVNTNFKSASWKTIYGISDNPSLGDILCHSATNWTILAGTNTVVTSDAGVTWTACSTGLTNTNVGVVCDADKTKAIAFYRAETTNITFTTDSGDNWTDASSEPADKVWCLSFPTTSVAVVGTRKSAGARGIYYSTDGGENWTICEAGPGIEVAAISMYSATNGFAIADGGNIWKTTDGGVNWADTTHTMADPFESPNILVDILAISDIEFVGIYSKANLLSIYYYDGSTANITFKAAPMGNDSITSIPFNPIKLTNGKFIYGCEIRGDLDRCGSFLFKANAKDSKNFEIYNLGTVANLFLKVTGKAYNATIFSSILKEYDTNKFMVGGVNGYLLFDES